MTARRKPSPKAKRRAERAAAVTHPVVAMAIPPAADAYAVLPFTRQVIDMIADADRALVYRIGTETLLRVAGIAGAAVRAARRRAPNKQFVMRRISHHGKDTYAVWRIK